MLTGAALLCLSPGLMLAYAQQTHTMYAYQARPVNPAAGGRQAQNPGNGNRWPSAGANRPMTQNGRQEHLAQWMDRHQNLSLDQQQRALANEPGFRQLPQQTQQRMQQRLSQLNAMPPTQRSHVLERAEQMENLNPDQRQQVRGAMSQLGMLPLDRRRVVAHAFRQLREIPPGQRQAYLNSGNLPQQLSPQERGTLNNLMAVEPLLPPQQRAQGYQTPANQMPVNPYAPR